MPSTLAHVAVPSCPVGRVPTPQQAAPDTGRPLRKTGRQTGANNGNASAADAPSAPHHQNHKEDKDRNRHFHNGWLERYQNESPERRRDEGRNPKWYDKRLLRRPDRLRKKLDHQHHSGQA